LQFFSHNSLRFRISQNQPGILKDAAPPASSGSEKNGLKLYSARQIWRVPNLEKTELIFSKVWKISGG
jgi:hypothetical protein